MNGLHERGQSPVRFDIVGLAAKSNETKILEQAERFGVRDLAMCESNGGASARRRVGRDAAERLVLEVDCDLVLAAMVGIAGLPATLAAVELGRDVALANKETLVAAGAIMVAAAKKSGAKLLPVDSEHSGVWQALGTHLAPPLACGAEVAKVTLTASGGPFRTWSKQEIAKVTPAQALRHPTWSMGPKVTIDSASLMNKALELIEAHWLFGLPAHKLDAVIHPQSIVHAIIEHADGSLIAQLAAPDMRLPIQVALTHPRRPPSPVGPVDLASLKHLDFETVDHDRFPAIELARRVIERGGAAGAALNAANEVAVSEFLAGARPFDTIASAAARALDAIAAPIHTLTDVFIADERARAVARAEVGS